MRNRTRLLTTAAAVLLAAGCGKGTGSSFFVPPLSAIVIGVQADTVAVNGTTQFSATAYDLSSQPVNTVRFNWTTSDGTIFTVNSSGLVTGTGEGGAFLYVEAGGVRDTAAVMVTAAQPGWLAQVSNSTRQLNDVFFLPDGRHGGVVGASGEILTTPDAGVTWTRQISSTLFNLNAVWLVDSQLGWAVGANGTALFTQNGGTSWTLATTGSSDNLNDVFFLDADHGWIVGSNGVVLRTVDGGANWTKQYPTGLALNGVGFAGLFDGWAVGNTGVILGTHDGGLNWFIAPFITNQSLTAVVRRSEPVAFAVGMDGAAPRTIVDVVPDSTVWELQNAGSSNDLHGVAFPTSSKGWAVGNNGGGIVLTTVDGGVTWTQQVAPTGTTLRGVWFVDTMRGWAVGDNGRILHTGNGGEP